MIDYHIHSGYTWDVEGKLEDFCRAAEQKEIKEIGFVNHFIIINLNKPGMTIEPEEIAKYLEDLELAKKKFNVRIKAGLEVDYWKSRHREIEEILDNHQFDFLLCSAHYLDGILVGATKEEASKFFGNKNLIEIYQAYFSRVIETVESQLFDVLAHPDNIRRNVIRCFGRELLFERYRKDVEKVVEVLADNKVGIEVNSSGYFHGTGDSFPSSDFLKICFENGVKVVTVGSDAHSPSRVGSDLDKVIEKLKEVGFRKISSFDKRKSRELEIEEL